MGRAKPMSSSNTETVRSSAQTDSIQLISEDERRRMIEEAAYYRAMQRGFNGGDPCDDWFVAEQEINRTLPKSARAKGGAGSL